MSVSTSSSGRLPRPGQTTGRTLELWLRPDARDGADRLIERVRSLEQNGAVDAVSVNVWDTHQDLSSGLRSHREREARATLQRIKRWAWQHGTALVGFGERRRAGRGRMGPEYVTQRVPPAILVEYDDDELLVGVTPCVAHERCVSDRLARLEALEEIEADTDEAVTSRLRR